jgi:hypothetical protein
MVPADQRTLPPAEPYAEGTGVPLSVVLTDAQTGIVRALRVIGLGTALTNALHQAIRAQAEAAFDRAAYDERLNRLYARYPQTDLMLSAAVARWPETAPRGRTSRGRPR